MKRAWGLFVLVLALLSTIGVVASRVPGESATPGLSEDVIESVARETVALARPAGLGWLQKLQALENGQLTPLLSAAPDAQGASDVLLQPADVGPNFIVISAGEKTEHGVGFRAQTLRQAGKHIHYVEPDGVMFVRSLAVVTPDVGSADRVFDTVGTPLFEGTEEVPVPTLGDRRRGALEWAEKPFDLGGKIIMFRSRTIVAFVIVVSYEQPNTMSDIVPLAQTMASRAGR